MEFVTLMEFATFWSVMCVCVCMCVHMWCQLMMTVNEKYKLRWEESLRARLLKMVLFMWNDQGRPVEKVAFA